MTSCILWVMPLCAFFFLKYTLLIKNKIMISTCGYFTISMAIKTTSGAYKIIIMEGDVLRVVNGMRST
jgi:hypothetical protein